MWNKIKQHISDNKMEVFCLAITAPISIPLAIISFAIFALIVSVEHLHDTIIAMYKNHK